MRIITRAEAIENGYKKYFTGVACKNGHVAQRYTKTTLCLQCNNATQKRARQNINAAMLGARDLQVMSHPDDHPAIRAYADMLNLQRGLNVTQPGAPAAATPQPQPATLSDDQLYDMWMHAHGPEIAATMLKQYRDSDNQLAA